MVATSHIEKYRAGNSQIVDLFTDDLHTVWQALDLGSPRQARDVLFEVLPELTDIYGEQAAFIAAEWFEELRALERVPGSFSASMAETVPREVVVARVSYGARHLFTEQPELTLPFLETALSEYVLQPGRDTIQRSSIEDPRASGWHRETRPSDSYHKGCGFCQMLAGRGGVYKRATASFAAHGKCHCVAVPSWDANAPEVPAAAYEASKKTSNMTAAQKQRHNEFIRAYVNEHHPVEKIS